MKNLLLAILSVGCLHGAKAQKIHFTDSSNWWKVIHYHFDFIDYGGGPFEADTVISGLSYRRLVGPTPIYHLAVREDPAAGKLYFRFATPWLFGASDTLERLLFDYNLKINDTLRVQYARYRSAHYVRSVGTVMIGSAYYKTWKMQPAGISPAYPGEVIGGGAYTFIEGIGPDKERFFPMFADEFENYQQLLCFRNAVWHPFVTPAVGSFDNDSSCRFKPAAVPEEKWRLAASIIPTSGGREMALRIENGHVDYLCQIFDGTGRLIKKFIVNSARTNIGELLNAPGVYYYLLQDGESGQRFKGRFFFDN